MKARGAIIQGTLAIAVMGAAYQTWQREPEKAAGDVVVLDAGKSDVRRVRYEDDKGWVELFRKDDPEGSAWVRVGKRSEPKGQEKPERELRGNEQAGKLLDAFGPLRAARALGVVDNAKLKEFGLVAPDAPDGGTAAAFKKKHLEVQLRADKRGFALGSPAGASSTYLKDERDGRVYLASGTVMNDLEAAGTRMVERALHRFKQLSDFDEIVVEAGGKKRELIQHTPEGPAGGKLASKKTPDKSDDTAKNWHDKLWRLYPTDTLGAGEKPAAGEPQVAVKVTYRLKGKEVGYVEVAKVALPPPPPPPANLPPPPPAPQSEFYARTEFTPGWIKLSSVSADDILKEADKIASSD